MNLVKASELKITSLQISRCQRNPTANHQLFLFPTRQRDTSHCAESTDYGQKKSAHIDETKCIENYKLFNSKFPAHFL